MKVAICEHLTASYWGGGEKEMMELASGLDDLGHDVEVYALPYTLESKRRRDSGSIYPKGIRYHERPLSVIRADVAYFMYHPFARFNFITRAPKIASFHSQIWFNRKREKYGIIPKAAARLSDSLLSRELSHYDAVQVHYPAVRREVERRAPGHPPTYTIEHFLDTDVFQPRGRKPADKFRVGFVG